MKAARRCKRTCTVSCSSKPTAPRRLGTVDLENQTRVTLYAEGDRLVVIGVVLDRSVAYDNGAFTTIVRTYTAAKGALPVVANERRYNDELSESRFIAGKVVLVFRST